MSNIAGSSTYSSANTSTSTLRPRGNRLISYLDESHSDNDGPLQTTSTSSSRGGSPPASRSHSRAVAQSTERTSRSNQAHTTNENAGRRSSSLWNSLSSLQGAASSFLVGGDSSTTVGRKGSIKTPAWMKQDSRFKSIPSTSQWGPEGKRASIPQAGSIEDRQAIVQAKKREALLLSCSQEGRDDLGHFKRKISYDAETSDARSELDKEQEALVYKHQVRPHETMAGVTIKYSCQPEAFRKLNRFWPNDNIQTRKFVLLPVEACSVRGRKVDDATSLELLATQLSKVELDSKQRSVLNKGRNLSPKDPSSVASPKQVANEEEDWKHDSYVLLPSFTDPVEILRIPRKALGYFPRTRRKSIQANESVTSTPKTSFDMLRHPPTHAAQQAAAALSLSVTTSPVQRPRLSSRQRSSSTTATTNSNSANAWILRGPGGVGDLRGLRTETSRPGPANDPLNQKFAQYFPSLVLQTDDEDNNNGFPSRTKPPSASRSPYRATPRASTDSIRSTRSNSSTFGVTGVENFMRKLTSAGKRPDGVPRTNSGNLVNAMGLPIGGETGLGDLIELENSPDALNHAPNRDMRNNDRAQGRDFDWEDDDATPTEVGKSHDDLLNERFPVRGRITRAYGED